MSDDRSILRDTWDGRLPVCFTLAETEVASEKPDPVYVRLLCDKITTKVIIVVIVLHVHVYQS